MRINRFVAQSGGLSRRSADSAIEQGRVLINGSPAKTGQIVSNDDVIQLDGQPLFKKQEIITLLLNKPTGYVVSRNGQGSKTIYDLLPEHYHHLKPVGRLDKDSSGLLLLTNDGLLAHSLTHPSFQKNKVYEVTLDAPLRAKDRLAIESGVTLEDGVSRLGLAGKAKTWTVVMHEGRNRQIRRTFGALGYSVTHLYRTSFGPYTLPAELNSGEYLIIS